MSRSNDPPRLRGLRDDRRGYNDHRKPKKGQAAKVIWIVAMVAIAGIFVVGSRSGCAAHPVAQTLPPKKSLASLKPKDLQQQTAEYWLNPKQREKRGRHYRSINPLRLSIAG